MNRSRLWAALMIVTAFGFLGMAFSNPPAPINGVYWLCAVVTTYVAIGYFKP